MRSKQTKTPANIIVAVAKRFCRFKLKTQAAIRIRVARSARAEIETTSTVHAHAIKIRASSKFKTGAITPGMGDPSRGITVAIGITDTSAHTQTGLHNFRMVQGESCGRGRAEFDITDALTPADRQVEIRHLGISRWFSHECDRRRSHPPRP